MSNSWTYAEAYVAEDDVLAAGRQRAGRGRLRARPARWRRPLRFLAALLSARAVVEIGTGTGVSGVWLLRGMR